MILFKLIFGAFDLATAAAVWFLATKRLRVQATVLYLLCPAVILQTWESAHAEAAAMLLCVLAAALIVRRRDGWAGIALGLAAAFKVTPLGLLVPALLGGRASTGRFLAGFARRSSSPTCRTWSPAGPSDRCSRAGLAGREDRCSSACSPC